MATAPQRLARIFQAIEVATVGLPFCIFKLLCGRFLVAADQLVVLGWLLIALGVTDVVVNALNLVSLFFAGRRVFPICTLQFAAERAWPRRSERAAHVGVALDTVLSLSLVATMIGFGALTLLDPSSLAIWNTAVILNVLGAGLSRLLRAL